MDSQSWILARHQPAARVKVFCFPYAGGNAASFMSWQNELSPSVQVSAVQLPGRGARFKESPVTHFDELVPRLAESVAEQSDLPFIFFGHSLGALVAYEVAHWLYKAGCALPQHLIVSAANAPSCPPSIHSLKDVHDDGQFIAELRRYGGTPEALLENRELMALLIPTIRADFTLLNSYRYVARQPLAIPITALAGCEDSLLSERGVSGWRNETCGAFNQCWLDGGHFYFHDSATGLMSTLRGIIGDLTAPRHAGSRA